MEKEPVEKSPSAWPLVVTLGVDDESQLRLQALRDRYFPRDKNIVPAHVSLFHKLWDVKRTTATLEKIAAKTDVFPIRFGKLQRLSRGISVRVTSSTLLRLRGGLARVFVSELTNQDRAPFKPHVTVMNKAGLPEVELAFRELEKDWVGWEGTARSFKLWEYRGGPWESRETFIFPSRT